MIVSVARTHAPAIRRGRASAIFMRNFHAMAPQASQTSRAQAAYVRDSIRFGAILSPCREAASMILPRRHFVTGAIAAAALVRATPVSPQPMLVELGSSQSAAAPQPIPAYAPPLQAAAPSPLPADTAPPWRRNAVAVPALDGRPAITLVIDDMGVTHPYTDQAMALPGPLTLAWFPFARDLLAKVAAAAARGHEAMLHMPMQSYSDS